MSNEHTWRFGPGECRFCAIWLNKRSKIQLIFRLCNNSMISCLSWIVIRCQWFVLGLCFLNTLRPRQNGRHFADDIFKCIFLNENASIAIKISLKFVPKGPITNISALVQIMAWRRPDDKTLFEPMMVSLPTHICVTRPQWGRLTGIAIPIINLRLSDDHLRFIMGIPIWGNDTSSPPEIIDTY